MQAIQGSDARADVLDCFRETELTCISERSPMSA